METSDESEASSSLVNRRSSGALIVRADLVCSEKFAAFERRFLATQLSIYLARGLNQPSKTRSAHVWSPSADPFWAMLGFTRSVIHSQVYHTWSGCFEQLLRRTEVSGGQGSRITLTGFAWITDPVGNRIELGSQRI